MDTCPVPNKSKLEKVLSQLDTATDGEFSRLLEMSCPLPSGGMRSRRKGLTRRNTKKRGTRKTIRGGANSMTVTKTAVLLILAYLMYHRGPQTARAIYPVVTGECFNTLNRIDFFGSMASPLCPIVNRAIDYVRTMGSNSTVWLLFGIILVGLNNKTDVNPEIQDLVNMLSPALGPAVGMVLRMQLARTRGANTTAIIAAATKAKPDAAAATIVGTAAPSPAPPAVLPNQAAAPTADPAAVEAAAPAARPRRR